uniref:Uncharacterized protein n=1 Tax=Oryza glaberrima TaxID=4538 RepID=I1R3S3_ORYGL
MKAQVSYEHGPTTDVGEVLADATARHVNMVGKRSAGPVGSLQLIPLSTCASMGSPVKFIVRSCNRCSSIGL